MFGLAVGAIGIAPADFDAMLPAEFGSVLSEWRRDRETEHARLAALFRLHAAISVQPHCRKPVNPKDLFEIPGIDSGLEEQKPISREEAHERFLQLMKEREEQKDGQQVDHIDNL